MRRRLTWSFVTLGLVTGILSKYLKTGLKSHHQNCQAFLTFLPQVSNFEFPIIPAVRSGLFETVQQAASLLGRLLAK